MILPRKVVGKLGYDGTLNFDTSINTKGFQTGIDKISSAAGTAIKATTAIIGGAATAVAGIGAAAVKVGSDFEAQMSRVQAISGATGAELESLKQQAIQLGADTAFSAKEAAEGMENLASAGFTTQEMIAAMPGMLDLAASSGEALASSADIAASTLRGFGLDANMAAHVADVLAKNAADTNAAVADTGEAMKYVAPVAKAMGISFEECAAAIGIMADAGIKGGQAGTTIRGALTRLAKPTKVMLDTMDALGLEFYNANGEMKSLTEITGLLEDKMADLTDEQRQNALVTLFGQESLSGMLSLMNRGSEELANLTNAYRSCDGAAQDMARTMQSNLKAQVEQVQGGLESLAIAVFEELKTPMTETVKAVNEMVDSLLSAFTENGFQGLVVQFGDCLAELSQMALEAAPQLIDAGVELVYSFLGSIANNSAAFAEAGAELVASLASAILSASGALWSVGIELFRKLLEGLAGHAEEIGKSSARLVNDIAQAVIENLPLIIQAGRDIIRGFCEGMMEEGDGIAALFAGFIEGFSDTAGSIFQGLADIVTDLFAAINDADPANLEAIGKAIGSIAAAIGALKVAQTVVAGVKSLITVLGTLKTGILGITEFVGKVGKAFSSIVKFCGTFGKAIAGVGSIIAGAVLAVTNFVDMFVNGFKIVKELLMVVGIALAAVGAVILGAPAAVAAAVAGIVAAIATLVVVIKDNWDAIVEFFSGLPDKIITAVSSLAEKLAAWGASMLEIASTAADKIVDSVVQFFSKLPGKILAFCSQVLNKFATWAAQMLSKAQEVGSNVLQAIISFFQQLPGKILQHLTAALTNLTSWASNMLSAAKTAASNILTSVSNYFSQMPGRISSSLNAAFSNLKSWASNMLSTAQKSASDVLSNVSNYFSQMPGRIWSSLSAVSSQVSSWGSSLVSSFASIGRNVISGLINGISSMVSSLYSSIQNALSGLVTKAKNALGIHSPSTVFEDKVGVFIPPGIGKGVVKKMPELNRSMDEEMRKMAQKMQSTVERETGKIEIDKHVTQDYRIERENGQSFDASKTEVSITGETHIHVELDGEEVGNAQTPIIDRNLGCIDAHKKRGG